MTARQNLPTPDSAPPRASDSALEVSQDVLAAGFVWRDLFENELPVEVEIGCGKGLFLTTVAAAHPEVNWFGLERSSKHLRRAITRVTKAGLTNVRFTKALAEDFLDAWLPAASVRAVHIFYPDPWPKKRHHRRRLLGLQRGPETLRSLERVIEPGGHLCVATDHAAYAEVIEEVFRASTTLIREPAMYAHTMLPDPEAPLTEFERKYRIEGREMFHFSWKRIG